MENGVQKDQTISDRNGNELDDDVPTITKDHVSINDKTKHPNQKLE